MTMSETYCRIRYIAQVEKYQRLMIFVVRNVLFCCKRNDLLDIFKSIIVSCDLLKFSWLHSKAHSGKFFLHDLNVKILQGESEDQCI